MMAHTTIPSTQPATTPATITATLDEEFSPPVCVLLLLDSSIVIVEDVDVSEELAILLDDFIVVMVGIDREL